MACFKSIMTINNTYATWKGKKKKKIEKQLSVLMNYYYFRCWFSDNFPLVIQNSPQKPIQQWSKLGKVKKKVVISYEKWPFH